MPPRACLGLPPPPPPAPNLTHHQHHEIVLLCCSRWSEAYLLPCCCMRCICRWKAALWLTFSPCSPSSGGRSVWRTMSPSDRSSRHCYLVRPLIHLLDKALDAVGPPREMYDDHFILRPLGRGAATKTDSSTATPASAPVSKLCPAPEQLQPGSHATGPREPISFTMEHFALRADHGGAIQHIHSFQASESVVNIVTEVRNIVGLVVFGWIAVSTVQAVRASIGEKRK